MAASNRILFLKTAGQPVDLDSTPVRADEPTPEQAKAGNYAKRALPWRGLTIRIENEAGSVRRGTDPGGKAWETTMPHPYGYIVESMGVDGDPVDVYVGPFAETAEQVFVVHQRKVGDWEKFDEDKVFVGFLTEAEAVAAFLSCYDDPRFLGPITAMPVDEFVAKVKATRRAPRMIKAVQMVTRRDDVAQRYHVSDKPKPEGEQMLADDMEAQMQWLEAQAADMGYSGIDDLVTRNYPAFEALAAKWREDHPVDVALKCFADDMLKARVGPYIRRGKLVNIHGYDGRTARAEKAPGQPSLFSDDDAPMPKPKKAELARFDHTKTADLFEQTATVPVSAEVAASTLAEWVKNNPRKDTLLWTESDFAQRKGLASQDGMRRLAIREPSGRVSALALFEDKGGEVELHFIGAAEKGQGRKLLDAVEAANPGKAIVANINGAVLGFYREAGYEVANEGGYYQARKKPAAPVKQTDTPQFRAWFGESKVTRDGEPLRMYHASYRDFDTFDRRASVNWRRMETMDTVGSWFSDSPAREGGAGMYADGEGAVMYPVYLSIQNPKFYATFDEFLNDMHLAAGRDPAAQNPKGRGTTEELREKLKAEGFDGIRFGKTCTKQIHERLAQLAERVRQAKDAEWAAPKKDRAPLTARRMKAEDEHRQMAAKLRNNESTEFDDQEVWVAFDPHQIKSAIGNNGDFSKDSPVITKSAPAGDLPILFIKAKAKGDDRTPDMFATHVETRTRKDGVVQGYRVANAKPPAGKEIVRTGDKLSDYWANSAGASIKRDVDAGRAKVVKVTSNEKPAQKKDVVRAGDVFRTPDGRAATVMRQIPGGNVEVRLEKHGSKRVSVGEMRVAQIKEYERIGRADYQDGLYSTGDELLAQAAGVSSAVTEPRAELIAEHERLVRVLESPSHADDKAEAKRQKKELEEYKAGGDAAAPSKAQRTRARRQSVLDVLGEGWKAQAGVDGARDAYKRVVTREDGGKVQLLIMPEKTVDGNFYVGSYNVGGARPGAGSNGSAKTIEEAKAMAERFAGLDKPAAPAAAAHLDMVRYLGGDRDKDIRDLARFIDEYGQSDTDAPEYRQVRNAAAAINHLFGTGRLSGTPAMEAMRRYQGDEARKLLADIAKVGGEGSVQDMIDAFYGAIKPAPLAVASKKKIRDPLTGTETHVTLSNGKTHRLQRLNATESMGLPGWHDLDGGFLADNEQGAIDELLRRASRPAPMVKSIRQIR